MTSIGLSRHVLFTLILISVRRTVVSVEEWQFTQFTRESVCNVEERRRQECSTEIPRGEGRLECLVLCSRNISCIGASMDDTGKCFHHQLCSTPIACTHRDTAHTYMARYCVQGTWSRSTSSCVCVNAAHGDRCEKYPNTCQQLLTAGYSAGTYHIFVDPFQDGKRPIKIRCYVKGSYMTIILFQNKGKITNNRTWDEYVNGFYVDSQNYWGGLRAWNILNEAGCRTLTLVYSFTTGANVYRLYNNLVILGKDGNYSFTLSGSSYAMKTKTPPKGSFAGDCLSPLKDTPFSTWDRDRDGNQGENCASLAGSGWWYSGCDNPCHLLGRGMHDYDATPSDQRLTFLGVDVDATRSLFRDVHLYTPCTLRKTCVFSCSQM